MNKTPSEAQENKLQQSLLWVIKLYTSASSIEDIECGIIKAKRAIEYICCHFEVSGEDLNYKESDKNYDDDDFRKLFCSLRIPLDRPKEETPRLQELVDKLKRDEESKEESKGKTIDTLYAFRKTRNAIVHLGENTNIPLDDEDFLKEAWNWGLQSVERFIHDTTAIHGPRQRSQPQL